MRVKYKTLVNIAATIAFVSVVYSPEQSGAASLPTAIPVKSFYEAFSAPARIAIGPEDIIYVSDPQAGKVTLYDSFGRVVSVKKGFLTPTGVAIDHNGNLYIGEQNTGSVKVFDKNWNFLYALGKGDGEFKSPNYITTTLINGSTTIFISDSLNDNIKIYKNGILQSQIGSRGAANAQFLFPAGIAISKNSELFVVDQGNDRVQVFDLSGLFLRAFTLAPPGYYGSSGRAQSIAFDSQNRIYVSDSFQSTIKVFSDQGVYLGSIGKFGNGNMEFFNPGGICVDTENRLWVASPNSSRIELLALDCAINLSASYLSATLPQGTNVIFSVQPTCPADYTFQWFKGTNILQDNLRINGSTSPVLNINSLSYSDAGEYSVVLNWSSGSITSAPALLTVASKPIIIASPQNQDIPQGSTIFLTLNASGEALSYQWFFNGLPLPGAETPDLKIINATVDYSGQYYAVVSNVAGSITTAVANVNVLEAPTIITDPQSQTVPEGTNVSLYVVATGTPPLFYRWFFNGSLLSGQTNDIISFTNVTPNLSGNYYVVVSNSSIGVTSKIAHLTVLPDTNPPIALTAYGGFITSQTIRVVFSKKLNPLTAQNKENYQILGLGDLQINNAALVNDSNVILTLNSTRYTNTSYTLKIQNITDTAYNPNLISPDPTLLPVICSIELIGINTHLWKYYQTTNIQGLDLVPWKASDFDDTSWQTGYGIFYGNRSNSISQPYPNTNIILPLILDPNDPQNTKAYSILDVFTNAGNVVQEITYYFRTDFNFPAETNNAVLYLHYMIDDGAVFYLNGQRIFSYNLSKDPVYASDLANALGDQIFIPPLTNAGQILTLTNLKSGRNVLAVEVHQGSTTSSDVTFGVRLTADVTSFLIETPAISYRIDTQANIILNWTAPGYVLEYTPDLNSGWIIIPDANSPFIIPAREIQLTPSKFYRLRKVQ